MSLKAILIFLFVIDSNTCEDWCPLIKHTNGTYRGLGIYRYFNSETDSTLVMHNRDGIQWYFNITSPGIENRMRIEMIENSSKPLKSDNTSEVVHRFGVFEKQMETTYVRNCEVLSYVRTDYQLL